MPDHSTLVKFHKRINTKEIDSLLCKKPVNTSAIDAYEFETNYRSYHYANVWNRQDKRKYRRYLKISIAICTASQYVLSQKIRKHINHNYVVIDKGYDSKSNR